jgi:hypothetical protein
MKTGELMETVKIVKAKIIKYNSPSQQKKLTVKIASSLNFFFKEFCSFIFL